MTDDPSSLLNYVNEYFLTSFEKILNEIDRILWTLLPYFFETCFYLKFRVDIKMNLIGLEEMVVESYSRNNFKSKEILKRFSYDLCLEYGFVSTGTFTSKVNFKIGSKIIIWNIKYMKLFNIQIQML